MRENQGDIYHGNNLNYIGFSYKRATNTTTTRKIRVPTRYTYKLTKRLSLCAYTYINHSDNINIKLSLSTTTFFFLSFSFSAFLIKIHNQRKSIYIKYLSYATYKII